MNTKTPKTKKVPNLERIAIALESIAKILGSAPSVTSPFSSDRNQSTEMVFLKEGTITFPEKTAEQIVEECDNQVKGGELLWNTEWFKNEDFYTKETCRPRTVKIPTEILHAGKSWNECKELVGEENMFNYAEIIYMLRESESFRKLLSSSNSICYTWTSSRVSDGYLAVSGDFDSGGANSHGWSPRASVSDVGVCLSK